MEIVPITYKIKFIDSATSMASSLWSVTNNHVDGYKVCVAGTKSRIHEVKYGLLVVRCLNCSKYYENEFGKDLSKKTAKNYIFCDGEIDKFCLMLRKDI